MVPWPQHHFPWPPPTGPFTSAQSQPTGCGQLKLIPEETQLFSLNGWGLQVDRAEKKTKKLKNRLLQVVCRCCWSSIDKKHFSSIFNSTPHLEDEFLRNCEGHCGISPEFHHHAMGIYENTLVLRKHKHLKMIRKKVFINRYREICLKYDKIW